MLQLDFFNASMTPEEKIQKQLDDVVLSSDKVRKGIYAKHAELAKKYMELHSRMEILERYICSQKDVNTSESLLLQME